MRKKNCRRVFSLSYSLRFSYAFSLYAYTYHIFGSIISRIESYSISSIIIDRLLIKGKVGENSFQQTGTCRSRSNKASDKIYFRRKEI